MNKVKYTVCILMSTYNGDKYIKQQLDSIFAQEDVDIKLVVRDDGSKDSTLDILRQYDSILLLEGANIGCEESFMELLFMDIEADYYAFADQDDVWHPRKMISAIENIQIHNCDLSVCNLKLVDGDLNEIGCLFSDQDIDNYQKIMDKFAQTNFHGCVQVWTNKLHKVIQTYRPFHIEPHDVWVNAIANIVSSTYIDNRCFINYRLHGNNVSGYTTNIMNKFIKRIKLYFGKNHPQRDILNKQLLDNFGIYLDKADSKYKAISLIANYKRNIIQKLKLVFSPYFKSMSFKNRLIWSLCVILNKY